MNRLQVMLGVVFDKVYRDGEELIFSNEDLKISFRHEQSCCEDVFIESIVGELDDLIGSPILIAEEVTNHGLEHMLPGYDPDNSCEWTFYKFATRKGYVDVRWFGTSNGYYSMSVSVFLSRKKVN